MSTQQTRTITPEGRLCFDANLFTPEVEGDKTKYKAAIVIPTGADLNAVKAMMAETANAKWPGVNLATLTLPIKKEDPNKLEKYPYLKGCNLLQGNSGFPIQVIDVANNEVNREGIKAGDNVRFSLSCYAYDFKGKKGIGFNINAVLKVSDNDAFFVKQSASDMFGSVMTEYSENATNEFNNFGAEQASENLEDFNF